MYVLMYVLPIFCFRLTFKVDGLLYIDLLLLQCRLNLRKFSAVFKCPSIEITQVLLNYQRPLLVYESESSALIRSTLICFQL